MALSSLEVSLAWLISKSVHRQAHRRLNEIENILANLAQLGRPVDVAREVRMSVATVEQLIAWVTEHAAPSGELLDRLELYLRPEVLIASARDGWIELHLA